MTGAQLKTALVKLYGRRGWQVRAAGVLDVDVATVRRWVSGERPVPEAIRLALKALAQKAF